MQYSNLRRDESGFTKLGPGEMVGAIMFVFVIAILGAAFTGPLQGQVNNWSANLDFPSDLSGNRRFSYLGWRGAL